MDKTEAHNKACSVKDYLIEKDSSNNVIRSIDQVIDHLDDLPEQEQTQTPTDIEDDDLEMGH